LESTFFSSLDLSVGAALFADGDGGGMAQGRGAPSARVGHRLGDARAPRPPLPPLVMQFLLGKALMPSVASLSPLMPSLTSLSPLMP
jgi:hypothetical protein